MNNDFRRDIILNNYQSPIHKGLINDNSYLKGNYNSDSCADNLCVMLKIENNKIKDILFDGEACAIAISATSIMIGILLDKSIKETIIILENYERMIDGKEYDKRLLKKLNVYDNVYKQPNRKECALLVSNAISNLIKKKTQI